MRDSKLYLEVPFYRQRFDFTCGTASLMMAMKYFYLGLKLTKSLQAEGKGNLCLPSSRSWISTRIGRS